MIKIVFTILVFSLLWVSNVQAEEVTTTPREVVQQWLQTYPNNLAQAVTLTSPGFREDLPPEEWIAQKKPLLDKIRFRYEDSQILKEEVHDNHAVIDVNVMVSTLVGEQIQRERYELTRYCSVWLLEKVQVLDERFLGLRM